MKYKIYPRYTDAILDKILVYNCREVNLDEEEKAEKR